MEINDGSHSFNGENYEAVERAEVYGQKDLGLDTAPPRGSRLTLTSASQLLCLRQMEWLWR